MGTSKALMELYKDITGLTAQGVEINRQRAFVKQYGKLPEVKIKEDDSNLAALKDTRRRLNDLICKTKKKLKPSAKPAKDEKLLEWQMKLEEAETKRALIDQQIKLKENGNEGS